MTSSPASGDTDGDGEDIEITVTFSKAVAVSGSPQFEFCMGEEECENGDDPPARRRASLTSGSGATELVFTYTVQPGDSDDDGIWIGDHTRTLQLDTGDARQLDGQHLLGHGSPEMVRRYRTAYGNAWAALLTSLLQPVALPYRASQAEGRGFESRLPLQGALTNKESGASPGPPHGPKRRRRC